MCAGQSTQSPILMMRLVDETVSIVKPTRAVRVIINEKQDGTFLRPLQRIVEPLQRFRMLLCS
jgi:hypothetical protein